MDDIREMQYKNLRECMDKNLIDPILGTDYYNMEMDTYTCDELTTEDLKYVFDTTTRRAQIYRNITIVLLIVSIIITILYFTK